MEQDKDGRSGADAPSLSHPFGAEPVPVSGKAGIANAARFYIDCEFDGHRGPLLSIAMVSESGLGLHVRTMEEASDPWVLENVVPLLDTHDADMQATVPAVEVGPILRYFMRPVAFPVIVADSPVDIGRFCDAISTDADGGWVSTNYEKMTFEVHNVDCYPTDLPGAVQHNAWWDAMALRHKLLRDSGSDPSGRRPEGAECEASQSGLSAAKASPKTTRPSREG